MAETVELWLRSVSSWTVGREGTFVDDLGALAEAGAVADYEVRMWNDHVPVDPNRALTASEETVHDRVDAMATWADERGYELPALYRTTKVRGLDGPSYEAWVLPLAALLGFADEDLVWMAPFSDGDEHVSVQDRLDRLAAGPHDRPAGREQDTIGAA